MVFAELGVLDVQTRENSEWKKNTCAYERKRRWKRHALAFSFFSRLDQSLER